MVMVRKYYHRRLPRGMTLIELMMVVAIMTILLAVAIPMVRPAFRNRQLREASRQVNVFFAAAKAVTAETGRPVGVWIEREWSADNRLYATRLYTAEVPPSFSGAIVGSRATITPPPVSFTPPALDANWPYEYNFSIPAVGRLQFDGASLAILGTLVADQELFFIRFDYRGLQYPCFRSGNEFFISIPNGAPPGPAFGLPYEITRGPSKSIANPLTLPGDTVLDLSVSGVGLRQIATATAFGYTAVAPQSKPVPPVIVVFQPSGQLGELYVDGIPKTPTGPLYFLVGRRGKMTPADTPAPDYTEEKCNLADPTNIWVTVNNRTGAITTDDNSVSSAVMTPIERITKAREYARESRQKGGR